jgi:hypothetical protein
MKILQLVESDNVEDDDDNCNKSLCQICNQSLELDMDLVKKELKKDGDVGYR